MVENIKSRVFFIVLLVLAAVYVLVRPILEDRAPFTLGLDLRGGVVLRYVLPEIGEGPSANAAEQLATTVEIFRNRLDATGLREFDIRPVGDDQIEIGVPGITSEEADGIKDTLQSMGQLAFRLEATTEAGIDVDDLRTRLKEDIAARIVAGETITRDSDFSHLTKDLQIEATGTTFRIVPMSEKYEAEMRSKGAEPLHPDPAVPMFLIIRWETEEGKFFTGEHVESVRPDVDQQNLPAVGFTIYPGKAASDFGTFTQSNIGKNMSIVLDGQVQSSPVINSKIPGRGIIQGGTDGFSPDERRRLIAVIKSGSLPLKPVLYSEQEVGPTLGEVAINRGMIAGGLAIGLVLVFMLIYYRKAGFVACLALSLNVLLLMAILSFLEATLTLPGIAGLVLTIGMAVDANILIFERIREEAAKGKTVAQAVKAGFDKAFFTIVDSNVTTFLTAFFLYQFGTGPIRGFAVTLMIGLATSMFSALYFSKTIFAWRVEKRPENLHMMKLLSQTNIPFLSYRKTAYVASTAAIVVGLVLFFVQGDDKYGMDFTGGNEAQIALKSPMSQAEVLDKVQATFPNASVVTVGQVSDGKALQFQIKDKSIAEETSPGEDPAEVFGDHILEVFQGLLLDPPMPTFALGESDGTGRTPVDFSLAYSTGLNKADLESALKSAKSPLSNVTVEGAAAGARFTVTGAFAQPPSSEENARSRIAQVARQFPAATGAGLARLSDPMPTRSFIGPKAGTELRDAAIRAIFFSLVGIILYIRLRFRQYRYGFAACAALVHDVLVTLGVIAAVRLTGLVDIELDLAIVAAFLTIIGYSLNDTIVIFDRVRENLPRMDTDLKSLLNRSINQTLSRTILTSLTTMISVLLLFAANLGYRNVLEGFAFSMFIGVIAGTYSTVFIASPVIMMISERIAAKKEAGKQPTKAVA